MPAVTRQLGSLCELTGVFDVDSVRAEAIARRHETRHYAALDQLLEDVDVVSIASPSGFHAEHALRALDAGLHVLIEKPLATNVTDAHALAAAAGAVPDRVVQVGHIEHFNPAVMELRKLLCAEDGRSARGARLVAETFGMSSLAELYGSGPANAVAIRVPTLA